MVIVTGGKQSQLLVLGLRLEFDNYSCCVRQEAKFGWFIKLMKKVTFVTFLSLNLNFDTQFKEFDVGNKGWEYKVSKKQP